MTRFSISNPRIDSLILVHYLLAPRGWNVYNGTQLRTQKVPIDGILNGIYSLTLAMSIDLSEK